MSFSGPAVFIDESGDLGLNLTTSKCRHFSIGFVYIQTPDKLRKRLRRILKREHLRGNYPIQLSELKYYLPETDLAHKFNISSTDIQSYRAQLPRIRTKCLETIVKEGALTFAAVVDKTKAHSSWKQEELYAFAFAETFVVNIMNAIRPAIPPLIVYDRGRLTPYQSQLFSKYLLDKQSYFDARKWKKYAGLLSSPIDHSSTQEACIWAADMVAGAYYDLFEHQISTFSDLLHGSAMGRSYYRLYWP